MTDDGAVRTSPDWLRCASRALSPSDRRRICAQILALLGDDDLQCGSLLYEALPALLRGSGGGVARFQCRALHLAPAARLDNAALAAIADATSCSATLTSLDLRCRWVDCPPWPSPALALARAVATNSTLTSISLPWPRSQRSQFFASLKCVGDAAINSTRSSLCAVRCDGVFSLPRGVEAFTAPREARDGALRLLVGGISNHADLRTLSFRGAGVQRETLLCLVRALEKGRARVHTLDLSTNALADATARPIAEFARRSAHLRRLCLADNSFANPAPFAPVLSEPGRLTHLDVRLNHFPEESRRMMAARAKGADLRFCC